MHAEEPIFGAQTKFDGLFQSLEATAARSVLRIGIQIRTGDGAFRPEIDRLQVLSRWSRYFDCANEIERWAMPNKTQVTCVMECL